jgi:hypothetical protein
MIALGFVSGSGVGIMTFRAGGPLGIISSFVGVGAPLANVVAKARAVARVRMLTMLLLGLE